MIITKASGLNDTSFGKIQAPVKQYLEDAETLAESRSLIPAIIPVENSSDWADAYGGQTSMSERFQPGGEGETYPEASVQDDYSKIVENDNTWRSSMSFTLEMIEDGKLGAVKDEPKKFVQNWVDTEEDYAADFFTKGIATSQTYEGKTFSIAGGDGVALFSTAHPSKTGKYADQTNLYNAEFSDTNLTKIEALLSGQRDANGRRLRLVPDTIIVPFSTVYDAAQRQLVFEAMNADGNPTSTDRAGVYNAGRYNIVVWNYLGSPAGMTSAKSWWMLADMKYIMMHKPYVLQRRVPLSVHSYVNENTDANIWKGRARSKVSPTNDWRGIVACIPGLGTSL